MRGLLRVYLFHLLALYLTTLVFANSFSINGDILSWLFASLVLSLLNLLVKPILKLLFFPVNALTLGLFTLVITSFIFFLFYKLTPAVNIENWRFPGVSIMTLNIPAQDLGFWGTLIAISFFISLLTGIFSFLSR